MGFPLTVYGQRMGCQHGKGGAPVGISYSLGCPWGITLGSSLLAHHDPIFRCNFPTMSNLRACPHVYWRALQYDHTFDQILNVGNGVAHHGRPSCVGDESWASHKITQSLTMGRARRMFTMGGNWYAPHGVTTECPSWPQGSVE